MACSCHGDSKISTSNVRPYDQCMTCARKHVVQAWQLWNEFAHEIDNRDFCSAELRACASHCKYIERELAMESRDIAKAIEMFEDGGISDRLEKLKASVTEAFFARNQNLKDKYDKIKEHR